MGYRGKLAERQQARLPRQAGLALAEIAARRGVSKTSVSAWVRDVEFDAPVRSPPGRRRDPNALQRRKQAASVAFWSALTGIPSAQFLKPYRAVLDPSIRHGKHVRGCVSIGYSCTGTHRSIMGLVGALLGDAVTPG